MKVQLLVASLAVALAKKAEAPPPPENTLVDDVTSAVMDVVQAWIGVATDCLGYLRATPRFASDVIVWAIDFLRWIPGLSKKVFDGDAATLDDLLSFSVKAASIVFVIYVSIAAFNLALLTLSKVRDYIAPYLTLPSGKDCCGVKLPGIVPKVRNILQEQVFDRMLAWQCTTVLPLDGSSSVPSVKGLTANVASAASLCMILSCAPAVLSLMRSGANKAEAEAIAWTIGSALGVQYLIKSVN